MSVGVRSRKSKKLMGWKFLQGISSDFVLSGHPPLQPELNAETARTAAETVRKLAHALQTGALQQGALQQGELLRNSAEAAQLFQRLCDDTGASSMRARVLRSAGRVCTSRQAYQGAFIIECLLLSSNLRDASSLKEVLVRAVKLALPQSIASIILESMEADEGFRKLQVPSPSKICRARFAADVAYMLHCRAENRRADEAGGVVRYVMIGSSVQGHYDFELIRVTAMQPSSAGDMYEAALQLHTIREPALVALTSDTDRDELLAVLERCLAADMEQQAYLSAGLPTHLLPAVVLGSGHATLYHKFHATMHAFWIETGSSLALEKYAASIFAFTSDQGVEFSLRKVPPILVRDLFPWIPQGDAAPNEHDWAPVVDDELELNAKVDLSSSCGVAGLLHILHNSTLDLGRSMRTFDDTVKKMSHLSKLLARKDPKQRLLQTCFSDRIGCHLQKDIKSFRAKLNPSRWGSIAGCVLELLNLERPLRYGWDKDKYGNARQGEAHDGGVDVGIVDEAICSADFWANLRMLESFAKVIQGCLAWIESCPCHHELPEKEFSSNIKATWKKCPLRGCRAPEVAHGEFQILLRRLGAACASELLTLLPRDIAAASRALLLQDFERGRAHLMFIVSLRLDHWRQQPWCVFGCAHHDPAKSKACLQRCLQLPASTSLVAELQAPHMRDQIEQYLNDAALATLPDLRSFLGKLYFAPIAERAVEGDHAQAGLLVWVSCSSKFKSSGLQVESYAAWFGSSGVGFEITSFERKRVICRSSQACSLSAADPEALRVKPAVL